MKKALFLFLLLISANIQAESQLIQKQVLGFGDNYQDAISNGLLTAVRQVRGLEIGTEKNLKAEFNQFVNDTGINQTTTTISTTTDTYELSKGWVKSFDVLEVTEAKKGGIWKVKLDVFVPQQISDREQDQRQRIAISPFRINAHEYDLKNSNANASAVVKRLADNISSMISNSQKFAIVNRQYQNEISSENKLLSSDNVPPEEASRIGQMLGADLMLVGNIYELKTEVESQDFYGAKNHRLTDRMDLSYSTIETASGKILSTHTKTFEYIQEKDENTINNLLTSIAKHISEDIVKDFFPDSHFTLHTTEQEENTKQKSRVLTPGSSEKPIKW